MLTHISVKNFAVVKQLDVAIGEGLTAITGETGAGKSIAIDALSLCLGDRADANAVRKGAEKAEIVAHFDITTITAAKDWLNEHELIQEDNQDECFIRRVVSQEGRSKAFINGVAVSLNQLKGLGQYLVSIHGQNAHHQLLKTDNQRKLLDGFAGHHALLAEVSEHYTQYQCANKQLAALREAQQQREDRKHLLGYQVEELNEFALQEDEFLQLELEHKKLSNSQTLLEQAQLSFYQLYENDEFNALSAIKSSLNNLTDLQQHDASLEPIVQMLHEAAISVSEASQEIRQYCDQLEIDPLKLQQVEQRYSQAMDLARKHAVMPEKLYDTHMSLLQELEGLQQDEQQLHDLSEQCELSMQAYFDSAKRLSESRQVAATKLGELIQAQIQQMNMPHAQVHIDTQFNPEDKASLHGLDSIQFKVSTNPGQAADVLDKVVSGGELSRIGLAIQVITSAGNLIPTLIFDEVDTGISGPTASIVGQLLRKLGTGSQVMCVTHLPQVAAQGHNQLFVTKLTDGESTETRMLNLTQEQRVNEVARLLAGDKLTDNAIANAKDLLRQS